MPDWNAGSRIRISPSARRTSVSPPSSAKPRSGPKASHGSGAHAGIAGGCRNRSCRHTPSGLWQRTARPAPTSRKLGNSVRQRSVARGQRGWNSHPAGPGEQAGNLAAHRWFGRGGGRDRGSARRPAAHGCRDAAAPPATSRVGPVSTIRPRYMTAIRSAQWRMTGKLWVMHTMLVPFASRRSSSRFIISPCAETSRPAVGSSARITARVGWPAPGRSPPAAPARRSAHADDGRAAR